MADRAEKCASDCYPLASFLKGACFYFLKCYKKAIEAYTKAEGDSEDGKFPRASYNKGLSHRERGEHEKAIEAFIKAERDSEDEKDPVASFNKGLHHQELGEDKKAVDAFTKAEKDSYNGKYSVASFAKGLSHRELGERKKAVDAFTKAENDSYNGKYPGASFTKGLSHQELGEHKKAIEAYTKAEGDSEDGKYPFASMGRGLSHQELGEHKKAIEAHKKAEGDSHDGKFPVASNNKGINHQKLGEHKEAIEAYTKAEGDSEDGKFPRASFNKGTLFYETKQYRLAEGPLYKAINDYSPKIHLYGNWLLSECLYKLGDYRLAKEHAFISLVHGDRDLKIVKNIWEFFSDPSTIAIYEQRKIYLERLNILEVGHLAEMFDYRLIVQTDQHDLFLHKSYDYNEGFHRILIHKNADFPEDITYEQRLRTAYLLYFLTGDYHGCFHVLDTLMDDNFGHGPLECWFYTLSSYLIGEPVSVLKALANAESDHTDWMSKPLNDWNRKLLDAIENKSYLDPYLLNLTLPEKILGDAPIPDTYHPWVKDLLEQLKFGTSEYVTPISDSTIKGVEAHIFNEMYFNAQEDVPEEIREWHHFKLSIKSIEREEIGFDGSIADIRDCIKNGVPYTALLLCLMDAYSTVEDPSLKKRLAILISGVLVSEQIDNKKNIPLPKGLLLDALESLSIDGLLFLMEISTFGLGTGIGILVSVARHMTGVTKEKRSRLIFDKLNEDIENLD